MSRLAESRNGEHYIIDNGPEAKSYIMLFFSAKREFGAYWKAIEMPRPSNGPIGRKTLYAA